MHQTAIFDSVSGQSHPHGATVLDTVVSHHVTGRARPDGSVTEIVSPQESRGDLGLVGPALAQLSYGNRWIAWVAPPVLPDARALAVTGIDLSRVLVIRPKQYEDTLSILEQTLRTGTCSAVLAWPVEPLASEVMQRLQQAARIGGCRGILFNPGRHPGHLWSS